ncbi:hypothetical protein ACFXHA_25060 [Nocardia sp. NPDC059240]|uniref:hypothetical protein n=1 Tax=Nocardia sp. NPDC059240 TaxID=3346786 RepID=UPI0036B0ACF5
MAVSAAILAMMFGGVVLSIAREGTIHARSLSGQILAFFMAGFVVLAAATLLVGGALLLFRLPVGRHAIVCACGFLIAGAAVGGLSRASFTDSAGDFVKILVMLGGTAALAASKSTKRWLAAGRA